MCVALVVALGPAPVMAQFRPQQGLSDEERGALEKEYEAAFQAVLKDPGSLDKTFRYAELAVAVGDLEGAISALERMLIYTPNLPRVRLELGSLYFRLGSYAIAKSYLTRAIEAKDVPADVRDRVTAFLEEIEKRASVHRLSGSIYAGMRFQTNANAGPAGRAVKALGADVSLDDEFTEQPDYNGFALVSLRHAYDLHTQAGDYIETNADFFGSRQIEQTQVDLLLGSINTGYRAKLLPETLTNATWRPYVLADAVRLDRALFFYTYGGGLNFTNRFNPN
ncbi:MAG: tetratricopeptide repeat protein, partial [Rhodospirillales bacterium]